MLCTEAEERSQSVRGRCYNLFLWLVQSVVSVTDDNLKMCGRMQSDTWKLLEVMGVFITL